MIRNRFDQQLDLLNTMLIEMGGNIEYAITSAIEALKKQDPELAKKTIDYDAEIDQKEKDIEALCLRLLLQQHPVASDLRLISAALKMITDMERIGDQAADISEIIGFLGGRTGAECAHIGEMAREAIGMVTGAVDAYVKRDTALAAGIIARDDTVDALFDKVKSALVAMLQEHPQDSEYALDILMIAKYFERIGDHAVNIAEWVEFSATGMHKGETEL